MISIILILIIIIIRMAYLSRENENKVVFYWQVILFLATILIIILQPSK